MRAVSTKDELGPPSLEVLVTYFSAHVYTKQLLVALLTWVLYEILITTGESVELFWKQRWNLSKSLFFINQYVGLFATTVNAFQYFAYHPSSQVCRT
ncbi:hypothetical protein FRC15_001757 [Serendipita sp. 397]|nr:hypothetical protein FRC15_001757 [Serendipita sp. 397]